MTLKVKSFSREELLTNTITHYNYNNLSRDDNRNCKYSHNNNCCAIGREIPNKLGKDFDDRKLNSASNVFKELPIRLQQMGEPFLSDIQSLHDSHLNWNETGLSEKGKQVVDRIIFDYKLDVSYDILLETKLINMGFMYKEIALPKWKQFINIFTTTPKYKSKVSTDLLVKDINGKECQVYFLDIWYTQVSYNGEILFDKRRFGNAELIDLINSL